MHMADALLSTAVGGAALALAAGTAVFAGRKARNGAEPDKIALTGVAGAFIFAAQMINFTIPGTGSSGHLVGGILLASMLGPYAGFLALCAVLLVQALFFGDGGLLALGCNILNMGFFSCLAAYPLIFRPIVRKFYSRSRIIAASVLSSVLSLQLGAFAVALETLASGRTQLPFAAFAALLQPIHLAIGLAEGAITSAILLFVWKARPELLELNVPAASDAPSAAPKRKSRILVIVFGAALALSAGLFWLASDHPDGLEWSIGKLLPEGGLDWNYFQKALFPDYGSQDGLQSIAGALGVAMTLALIIVAALLVRLAGKIADRARKKHDENKN
jgi:cobalt/nickel transport system permease protein